MIENLKYSIVFVFSRPFQWYQIHVGLTDTFHLNPKSIKTFLKFKLEFSNTHAVIIFRLSMIGSRDPYVAISMGPEQF